MIRMPELRNAEVLSLSEALDVTYEEAEQLMEHGNIGRGEEDG